MTKTAHGETTILSPNSLIQSYVNAFVQFQTAPWLMWAYLSRWAIPVPRTQQAPSSGVAPTEVETHDVPRPGEQVTPAAPEASVSADADRLPVQPAVVAPEPTGDESTAVIPVRKRAPKTSTATKRTPKASSTATRRTAKATNAATPTTATASGSTAKPRPARAKTRQPGEVSSPVERPRTARARDVATEAGSSTTGEDSG